MGCYHSAKTIIDNEDLEGTLNVLARRIGDVHPSEIDRASFHAGAYTALQVLLMHDWRDQSEFFVVFDALVNNRFETEI